MGGRENIEARCEGIGLFLLSAKKIVDATGTWIANSVNLILSQDSYF